MKTLKIDFINFWDTFNKNNNYFYNLLSTKFNVIIDEEYPDLTFSSCFGNKIFKNNTKKVFYTGECVIPNWDYYDLCFTFEYTNNSKNYRLPLWVLYLNWFNQPYSLNNDPAFLIDINSIINKKINIKDVLKTNYKFCNFIYSKPAGRRMNFFPKFYNKFNMVESPGKLFNNTNFVLPGRNDSIEKINYLSKFKFTISFENTSSPGYTTEKILHPMSVNSIPIYWGNPHINTDFNENSFINANNYSDEELINLINNINNNIDLYINILQQPWFKSGIPENLKPNKILERIENIL